VIRDQPVPAAQRQYLDMVHIPFWSGTGSYPSVTVRMDFRGQDIGDFVYHCHILEHEDHGMMAIIQVNPATASAHAKPSVGRTAIRALPLGPNASAADGAPHAAASPPTSIGVRLVTLAK